MSFLFEKHFTLDEANAMIPAIQKVFDRILLLMSPPEETEKPHSGNGNGNGNGNGTHAPIPTRPQDRVNAANELLRQIAEKGIIIQDWRRGLIDFPHVHNDEEILLCYELSD